MHFPFHKQCETTNKPAVLRRASAIARLTFAALSTSYTVATADELLVNGNFDQGATSWSSNPQFPAFSPIFNGHISVNTPDFSNNWIARQNLNVSAPANVKLTLSADLKAAWTGPVTVTSIPAPGGGLAVAVEDEAPPNGTPRFLGLTVSPR